MAPHQGFRGMYPYNTKHINLPGDNNVAYIDEGQGARTLLFIHGLANYAMVWRKNIDTLRSHYRCIAIDLPGNGLSSKEDRPYGIPFYTKSVYDFIQALGLKNFVIVGHSMGGQIAMATLIAHPGLADALVLCAPAGMEEFTAMDRTLFSGALHFANFLSSDENNLRQIMENAFYRHKSQADGIIQELFGLMKNYKGNSYRKMVDASVKSMLEESVFEKLHLITLPTLVIFGLHDKLIPNKLIHHTTTEKLAKDAVAKMPHATLKLLPDCGHFVQWEKADEVNSVITNFVK
jgi:pimeloyl-ACP methyl ester carboxylesterase